MNKEYRLNAGIVVFNSIGKVLLCDRADQKAASWQFPQGGIEKEESPLNAARRELYEETGIKSVKPVAQMPQPLRYDFPKYFKMPFRGQEQYWTLFYFSGDEREINLQINTEEIEFRNYKWADIDEAPKLIVDFKKEVYNKVVSYFQPLIVDFLRGKADGI